MRLTKILNWLPLILEFESFSEKKPVIISWKNPGMTLNFEQNLGILKKKYFGKILEYPRVLEVYKKIVNYTI